MIARLELQLIEQPGIALGALAELLARELLDLQLQVAIRAREGIAAPNTEHRSRTAYHLLDAVAACITLDPVPAGIHLPYEATHRLGLVVPRSICPEAASVPI